MKKVVLIILILLICKGSVFSQFDAQLSQYMFHKSSFNPAAVGEGDMIQIAGQHRIQWVGIPNAGQTTIFSVGSPMKFGDTNHGIGIKFLNENVGLFTNQTAHIQYAYKRKLGDGILSLGTDFGFTSLGFSGDSVKVISLGEDHDVASDPEIPKSKEVGMSLDLGFGLMYSTSDYYAGISILHLNNPTVNWGERIEFKQNSTVFLTGGYNFDIPDTKYVFKPSTLLKTDFATMQLDLTARAEYDNKYWGGLSYRIQDAIVFIAGLNVAGGLAIGYSYDLPTSHIITASSGSHEIVLLYNFEYVFGKRTSKYKSIRIL